MKKKDSADIRIDQDSGVPIWLQLNNQIAALIYSGVYPVGSQLPTVREMAVQVDVNYNTVSKVYQNLERAGLIVSKRGKGSFVESQLPPVQDGPVGEGECFAREYVSRCKELGLSDRMIVDLVSRQLEKA
ncbi:GntR family transcriptional regulator [bacterium]|nr:GntR family transcriptional regulator [bacterium]